MPAKTKEQEEPEYTVKILPKVDLTALYEMMKPVAWTKRVGHNNRRNFPPYRGAIFGLTRPRNNNAHLVLSKDSKRHPDIYKVIMNLGKEIVPFKFNSVQVNRNLECPPHRDRRNVGDSLLVSFGEYTGGEIVVEGRKFNAFHQPIVFNGSELEHWNMPIHGDKFSLVFFTNP
jgi:hypothetical protein